jgi:hypothetical protein
LRELVWQRPRDCVVGLRAWECGKVWRWRSTFWLGLAQQGHIRNAWSFVARSSLRS